MLNKFKSVTLISGLIFIFMTVIFYLFVVGNIFTVPIHIISLIFMLLAEIIAIIKIYTINKSVFFGANIVTSAFHLMTVIVVSVIFINNLSLSINKYILLNLLVLCVMFLVDVLVLFAAYHVSVQNDKLDKSKFALADCIEKASLLCSEYCHSEYIKDLEDMVELLKYSDDSVLTHDEQQIKDEIYELHKLMESKSSNISDKILEIKQLIEARSIKLSGIKKNIKY